MKTVFASDQRFSGYFNPTLRMRPEAPPYIPHIDTPAVQHAWELHI